MVSTREKSAVAVVVGAGLSDEPRDRGDGAGRVVVVAHSFGRTTTAPWPSASAGTWCHPRAWQTSRPPSTSQTRRWKLWLSSLMSRYRASSGCAATFAHIVRATARERGPPRAASVRRLRSSWSIHDAGGARPRRASPAEAEGVGGPTWERSRGVVMGAAEERARGLTRARASRSGEGRDAGVCRRGARRLSPSWTCRRCPRTASRHPAVIF